MSDPSGFKERVPDQVGLFLLPFEYEINNLVHKVTKCVMVLESPKKIVCLPWT